MNVLPARIHILESPSPDDFLRGTQEGRALYETLRIGDIDVRVHTTITRAAFQICITQITEEFSAGHHLPIIHISAHGNAEGIAFSDGSQLLDWKSLGDILLPLHKALGGYLLICLSTCFGGAGFKMACRLTQHTFHTLIGAKGTVSWNDSLVAFTAFYHNLICKNIDIPSAIEIMHVAAGLPKDAFQMVSGEDVRKSYMKGLIAQLAKRIPKKPALTHTLRTAPCVTAPASTVAFPPTMKVLHRTPRSVNLPLTDLLQFEGKSSGIFSVEEALE